MKKETKTAPKFEIKDSGKMNKKEKIFHLYIDGVTDEAKFDFHKDSNEYWSSGLPDNSKFSKKIGKIACEFFPEKVNVFLDRIGKPIYKLNERIKMVFLRREGKKMVWLLMIESDNFAIFDEGKFYQFFDEFFKIAKKFKFIMTKTDDSLSFDCFIPISKDQTIAESYMEFHRQVNSTLYETDKSITDNLIKRLLVYQKSIVKPV
jgi:hypothetical protein